jgi:cytochrome c
MLRRLLSAAVLVASTNLAVAQDIDNGAIAFKKCIICHKIGPGAINGIGPGLNGLDGRPAVSAPYFSYSDANKNSGIVWNEQIFEEYIKDPKAKIPETKKIFAGIKNEKEAKDLWAYLKQFDSQGKLNR